MIIINKSYSILYTILITLILPSVFTSDDQYYTEECYFINQLRNKVPKYKCCNGGYVKCSGDHIIEIEYYDYNYNDKNITMPNVISRMPYLEKLYFYLSNNDRSFILPRFYGLDNLRYLYINGKSFTGNIPPSIGELSKLEYLNIFDTRINGTFPTEIGQLINLKEIHFHHNMEFDGPLPSSIGKLTNLKILEMFCNSVGGSLPSSIGNLSNLKDLYLWRNKFTGRIPSSIDKLTNVESIMLSENYFMDSIPSSIGNLNKLKYLNIEQNNITGEIPSSIGNLQNLESLKLSDNNLSGPIPSSIGKLKKLKNLRLNNNKLEGPLPSFIGDLTQLEYLYLNNNKLNDTIPATIGKIMNLRELYLNDNNFSNILPYREIEELTALEYLNLGNNHELYGKVPDIFYLSNIKKYNFNETSLCYSENDITPINLYPGINYNCTTCTKNASINNDVCKCNNGYTGIGYINCYDANEHDSPCISSNSFDCTGTQSKTTNQITKLKWRVGIKTIEIIEAYFENDKETILKAVNYSADNRFKEVTVNAVFDILQSNKVKRKVSSAIRFYNLRHVGILIGNELLDFDNNGYHQRYYYEDEEPGWNWNFLGNEYNGVTEKTASDIAGHIEYLADLYKQNPNSEGNLCFTKECNNYNLFCHNCHDFVSVCLNLLGINNSKILDAFSFKNEEVFRLIKVATIIKPLELIDSSDIIESFVDSAIEKFECSMMEETNNKIKRFSEKVQYQVICWKKPIPVAVLDDIFINNYDNNDSSDTNKNYTINYNESQCYKEIDENLNISDINLYNNGIVNINYFSFQYIISAIMLIFTWWIFILH